jgi:WD40 repeat protein
MRYFIWVYTLMIWITVLLLVLVGPVRPEDNTSPKKASTLDLLDVKRIPQEERSEASPKEVVAVLRAAPDNFPVFGVAFSSDGEQIASGGVGQSTQVWDLKNLTASVQIPSPDISTISVGFADGNKRLFTLNGDGSCCIWKIGTQDAEKAFSLSASGRVFQQLAVARGHHRIAFDTDRGVVVYDLSADPPKPTLTLPQHDGVVALAFSGDGKLLVTATPESMKVWDISGKECQLTTHHKHEEGIITAVASSRSGTTVAGSEGYDVRVYVNGKIGKTLSGHKQVIKALAFLGEDSWPLLSADHSGRLMIWAENGEATTDIQLPNTISSLAVSADCQYAATANSNGTVCILRLPQIRK